MNTHSTPIKHSIALSIFLHLFPGAVLTLGFLLLAPVFADAGLPPILGLIFVDAFIVLPLMIGIIIYSGRKFRGENTSSAIRWREMLTRSEFLKSTVGLLIWAVLIFILLAPLSEWLKSGYFYWIPSWLDPMDDSYHFMNYHKSVAVFTWLQMLIVTSIAAPIVEEYYFRGFLLPAIERFGIWAPFFNTVLFTIYHFWTLWLVPVRILALLPMVYVVWLKRCIYIAIAFHLLLNLIGDSLLTLPLLLN